MGNDADIYSQTTPLSTSSNETVLRQTNIRRRPFLLVYQKDRVDTVHIPPAGGIVVGREPPSDLVIADSSLSRTHARFRLEDGQIFVEDLGSTNGTRLGGRRVEQEVIKPGQVVTLGAVTIGVHILPAPQVAFADLGDHDSLRERLQTEMERSRFFGRPLSLLTIRSREGLSGHVLRWSPRVREVLRPVDTAALYSADTLQVLLPEMGSEQAVSLVEKMVARIDGEPLLGAGIACFPGVQSPDELIEESRKAALLADDATPVRVAFLESSRELPPSDLEADGQVVAKSPQLRAVLELCRRASRAVVPVLLQGETGTGKEVLARFIHESGPRASQPMICVNCGALPVQLIESALFGHERGAFTGAVQQQKGVFEAADGGTVFLDEVGELPPSAQAALLRVLESKRISRVGSTKEIEVDARIIAATHRDLESMVAAGTFRQDLYYRLCVMNLEIPPLRERKEDIPLLASRFVQAAARANGSRVRALRPEVVAALENHSWPGNVRELRNALERAVVIAEGETITLNDLSERLRGGTSTLRLTTVPPPAPVPETKPPSAPAFPVENWTGGLREQLDKFEQMLLLNALRSANGSQAEAAKILDIPLRTLQHRLKAHGIRKAGYAPKPDG
ncbi:MAG: sigma 54-interacting transcriptional regulator [Polyangiaceae bacterium]|nr:sigma 54-interacting transcriptional regulator [Polyangiaceae bacterium]